MSKEHTSKELSMKHKGSGRTSFKNRNTAEALFKFMVAYAEHGTLKRAGEIAGYSPNTIKAKGGELLNEGLERYGKELGLTLDSEYVESIKKTLGFSTDELVGELQKIVRQDDDKSTKWKAVQAVLKKHGVDLTDKSESAQAPPVNITVKELHHHDSNDHTSERSSSATLESERSESDTSE